MADAAEEGILGIVTHCQTPRYIPTICNAICGDRNAKLRQCCISYLLQASFLHSASPLRIDSRDLQPV